MERRQPLSAGRPAVARGAAVLAALILLAAISGGATPRPAQAAALDNCSISPYCWYLTENLWGNGTGTWVSDWYQFDGRSQVVATTLNCLRSGGTSSGVCSKGYYYGLGEIPSGLTIHFTISPAVDSIYCSGISCGTNGVSGTTHISGSLTNGREGFTLKNPRTLVVTKSGNGSGKVTSEPRGIDCGSKCSSDFAYNSSVALTAVPDSGQTFTGWSGPCAGQGLACTLTLTDSGGTGVNAAFALPATPAPPTAAPTRTPPAPTRTPGTTKAPPPATASPSEPSVAPVDSLAPPSAPPVAVASSGPTIAPPSDSGSGATTPQPTAEPADVAGASDDTSALLLVILVVGLALAAAIAFAGFELRRRRIER